jgi:PAS domain S-box-containing protein
MSELLHDEVQETQPRAVHVASYAHLLIFIFLTAGIITLSFLYYQHFKTNYRKEYEKQLSAIAELKVGELAQWRTERWGHAAVLLNNGTFSDLVRRFFEKPEAPETSELLREWLGKYQTLFQYDQIILLDARSTTRMTIPANLTNLSSAVTQRLPEVLQSGQVTFLDFYRDETDHGVYLAMLIPILQGLGSNRPLGTVVFRINPETYLYPFIKRWPIPSLTAETLLVRREGNEAVFLNELRFATNTALRLRVSLDRIELPGAQAVLGREGIMEGNDYRGVPVVAALRTIPDSPWALVARVDKREVFAAVWERRWLVIGMMTVLLLTAGVGVSLLWRHQQIRFYKDQAKLSVVLAQSALRERDLLLDRVQARDSNARLATAVEQAAETIVITDEKATILYVNPVFEKTSGYTREEAVGKNPRILQSGRQDADFYRQLWEGLSAGKVWSGRIVNRRKDGGLFEEDATISPVFDVAGKIINYVAVKRDVTRELQLEQKLLQAQKMEAVGRLAGGVAHDFNNILSIIVMNAAELSKCKDLTPTQADEVNDIALASERGSNLTRQLLAFSHTQVLQMGALDLNEVVAGIAKMLHRLIGEDISLNFHPAPGRVSVWADRGMIEQILLNLAVNSRDAMPEGGRLDVELTCLAVDAVRAAAQAVTAGDFVCLTVRDTGCGIAPEHLPHLFEPFYTTKAVGQGTGLGLATVHGIVEQHHGWVEIESQLGKGTTCRVYLPKLTETEAPKAAVSSPVELRGGRETILVVEDDLSLRNLAVRLLEQYGYRVFEASNGVMAAELWRLQGGVIDLLLTDVIMPGGVSGGKLAEQLRSEKPQLKVIFMSGYPGAVASRGVILTSGMSFIQKPFATTKLVQAVRESLDQA